MILKEHVRGTVEFYDGSSAITLSDENVISCSTVRRCCADGAFEIGGVYAGTLSAMLRLPGKTRFQVRGAKITLFHWFEGLETSETAKPVGVFWVTSARKSGDIFTISGMDAMGWADTSSYNDNTTPFIEGLGGLLTGTGPTLESWMGNHSYQDGKASVMYALNLLVGRTTGVYPMLVWDDYDESANNNEPYCGKWIYVKREDGGGDKTIYPQEFFLYRGNGLSTNDKPRDFLRYLAELTGGFITVKPDGHFTLRMFRMPELGCPVITMGDAEIDSFEAADYRLLLQRVTVRSEISDQATEEMDIWGDPSYNHVVNIRYLVESNPFLDGFVDQWVKGAQTVPNVWTIAHNLWRSFYEYNNDPLQVRPFSVRVHTTERYELGQKVKLEYRDYGESSVHNDWYSVLTCVKWKFHGGWELSCGGDDSRVMADCIKGSKADRVAREMRSRAQAGG